jgi:hypothetical protein
VGGDLTSDGTIWIGEFLGDDITVAASGLKGQVIINAWEYGATWEADVIVGTTILSPIPLYTNTGFGGGAVGEVPFGCHVRECDPPMTGGAPATTSSASQEIELFHYGPVTWDGNELPVTVGVCAIGTECEPADDTSNWEVVGSPPGTPTRFLTIKRTGGLADGKHYHIKPVRSGAAMLKCAGIPSQFTPVRDYTYTIEVDLP